MAAKIIVGRQFCARIMERLGPPIAVDAEAGSDLASNCLNEPEAVSHSVFQRIDRNKFGERDPARARHETFRRRV
jgi:hypothetical protein